MAWDLIIFWWWWLGRRIDLGLLRLRFHRRWMRAVSIIVALGLYAIGLLWLFDWACWWSEGRFVGLRLVRTAGPILWCLAIAVVLTILAARVDQPRDQEKIQIHPTRDSS
jgi:hypothetical protein